MAEAMGCRARSTRLDRSFGNRPDQRSTSQQVIEAEVAHLHGQWYQREMATPASSASSDGAQRVKRGVIGPKHIFWTSIIGSIILAGLGYLAWRAAGRPDYTKWYELARTVLFAFAAVGALPAGYIAYRRQKTLETSREDNREKHGLALDTENRLREAETRRQEELDNANQRADAKDLRERYTAASAQLGNDNPAVRLAGVHAMSQLADDWGRSDTAQRQTCVDVLCAYVCLPMPERAPRDPAEGHSGGLIQEAAEMRVRETVIRTITGHLRSGNDGTPGAWKGLNLDFTGAQFPDGNWDFGGATFSGGKVTFEGATFSGGNVTFLGATFSSGRVIFNGATFSGGNVSFVAAEVSGTKGDGVTFDGATFSGGNVAFGGLRFSNGAGISFDEATFSGGEVSFGGVDFSHAAVTFDKPTFSGGAVTFNGADLSLGSVTCDDRSFEGTDSNGDPQFSTPPGPNPDHNQRVPDSTDDGSPPLRAD
jgi:Pentapeptide repeats (9 copies)